MKRINLFFCLMATVGMMFLSGCSKEERVFDNGAPASSDSKLSFVIPSGKKGVVTYAPGDSVGGLDEEYTLKNLYIYWFKSPDGNDAGHTLYKIFSNDDNSFQRGSTFPLQLDSLGNRTVVTVDIGEAAEPSRFYIMANVGDAANLKATALHNLTNTTTTADFEKIVSDAITKDASGDLKLFETPLPMSISKTGTGTPNGYVFVNDPSTEHTVDNIHLKRRVARFDIINNADYTNFKVTGIIVSRAKTQAFLGDSTIDLTTPTLPSWWDTSVGNFTVNLLNQEADGTPAYVPPGETFPADADKNGIPDVFEDPNNANFIDSLENHTSIFYLLPTVLLKNDVTPPTTGTEIMIRGQFNHGATRLYHLTLPADVPIQANNVYRIKVHRYASNSIDFELYIDKWENSTIIETVKNNEILDWSANVSVTTNVSGVPTIDMTGPANSPQTFNYSSTKSDTATITIVTTGTSTNTPTDGSNPLVTTLRISADGTAGTDYLQTDLDSTKMYISSSTVMTYGATYTTTHVIKLPPTSAPLTTKLLISNPANNGDSKSIILNSINYNKAGKAVIGTALDPNVVPTDSMGMGRWQKAVVTAVTGDGRPTKVFAVLGTTTVSDWTDYAVEDFSASVPTYSPSAQIEWINSHYSQNVSYKIGETFAPNEAVLSGTGTGGQLVIKDGTYSNAIAALGLSSTGVSSNPVTYKAIVVTYNKNYGANSQIGLMDVNGKMNFRSSAGGVKTEYSNSVIAAVIVY